MMTIWRGSHSQELQNQISKSWDQKELLIIVSPVIKDFSFISLFENISFQGDWADLNPDLLRARHPYQAEQYDPRLTEARFALFTSGTQSGQPRLVFYSEKNVLTSLENIRALYDVTRIHKIFCFPQPSHTFGFILGYLHSLLFQIELLPLLGHYSKKTLQQWFDLVDENTLTLGTPTHFIDLLSFKKNYHLTAKKSYSAIIGGAPVTRKLWRQIQSELNVEQPSIGYGATEASPGVMHLAPGQAPLYDADIGQPLPGIQLQIQDDGYIFSGPNVCFAIFENFKLIFPDKIKLKDVLHEQNGHYYFVGRSDLIVNRGGMKISLEKVENLIQSNFSCKCLAVDIFDPRLGKEIYLLVQSDQELDKNAIVNCLTDEQIKILPDHIYFEKIPLNINLKFNRNKARQMILQKKTLKMPLSVDYLVDFMPHRHSAIWLDELVAVRKDYGLGVVKFDSEKPYASYQKLRPSSCIEFVAQCCGYSVVMQDILNLKNAPKGQTTLIVEVKNVEFLADFEQLSISEQDSILVEVVGTLDFGQLQIFKGRVMYQNQDIATLELKAIVT